MLGSSDVGVNGGGLTVSEILDGLEGPERIEGVAATVGSVVTPAPEASQSVPPAAAAPSADAPEPMKAPVSEAVRPAVKVTEEDRDAFMRHVLGAGRFSKTYALADGAARVVLQSRTVEENDEIFDALAADARAGKLPSNPASTTYVVQMYRLFLVMSLASAKFGADVQLAPPGSDLRERHRRLVAGLNETQFRMLLRCQEHFEQLVAALYREAVDRDFSADRADVS